MPTKSTKPTKQATVTSYEYVGHPYPIRVHFAPTPEAWGALLAEIGIDEPYPSTHGRATLFTHPSRDARTILTLSPEAENRNSIEVVGLMAHEITHAIQHIEDTIGTHLDAETEAYLHQALIQWLLESYADAGRSFTDAP